MPKKVIPFLYVYDDTKTIVEGLKHLPDVPIRYLTRTDGSAIGSEKDVAAGDDFIFGYGSYSESKGVFRGIDETFEATLQIIDFENFNKSSIELYDKDKNVSYTIYPAEFLNIAKKSKIENGEISGKFGFVSKGIASSLTMIID